MYGIKFAVGMDKDKNFQLSEKEERQMVMWFTLIALASVISIMLASLMSMIWRAD